MSAFAILICVTKSSYAGTCYMWLQIEAQLTSARTEVNAARTSAQATQQELNEERRSRIAAEKLVAELRSKLDSVKAQAAAVGASAAADAAVAGAPETNGSGASGSKVPVSVGGSTGGKKGGKKGASRGVSPTNKGFGSPK